MRVRVGDVRLYFEAFGEEYAIPTDAHAIVHRPVVIGLHGGPGADGAKLRFLLRRLSDVAQVIVLDQRGHGRSDRGEPRSWNLQQWAADLRAFVDALGIERPIVLGESFGGFVAQRFAATYPEDVVGLILVSCGARFAHQDEIAAQAGAEVASVVTRGGRPDEETTIEDWQTVVEPLLRVRQDSILNQLDALRIRTEAVTQHFEAEGFSMDLRPLLTKVRCPTLLIVGERDPLVPPKLAEELIDALPTGVGQLAFVSNASHQVLTDNPAQAWRLVRDFLNRIDYP